MAQKAAKTLAANNQKTLDKTHAITLMVNTFFMLLYFLRGRRSILPYVLLSLPALGIEIWFDRIARPRYRETAMGTELQRAGEDLEAKGLTEWMWDVIYWTWACTVLVTLFGNWAWWLYAAVPLYSAWLAFSTYTGARKGMGGLLGGESTDAGAGGQSKRQAKMEKRGGQRMTYRS